MVIIMKTRYMRIDDPARCKTELGAVAEILKRGGLAAIPTETVYGLAANAYDEKAVDSVFKAKGRANDNPLIVHIADLDMLGDLVSEIPDSAYRLAEAFWPGPLTIIMKKKNAVPDAVTCGMDTVAVRMPSHPVARAIISASGLPLAAPSANRSGGVSPTSAEHCAADLDGLVDAIVDGGKCTVGLESTVISVATNPPRLLRPGFVTPEELKAVIGKIEQDPAILKPLEKGEKPASPGMKYKHYSPSAKVVIVDFPGETYIDYVNSKEDDGLFALCFAEDIEKLVVPAIVYGSAANPASQAAGLFESLRAADERGAKLVLARMPSKDGVGLAVLNRLLRAAGFSVIKPE